MLGIITPTATAFTLRVKLKVRFHLRVKHDVGISPKGISNKVANGSGFSRFSKNIHKSTVMAVLFQGGLTELCSSLLMF